MSVSFEIASLIKPYKVTIEQGGFKRLRSSIQDPVVLCDDFFETILCDEKRLPIISVRADEEAKSLDSMSRVIVSMRELGVKKGSTIAVVGGGCIQDIATFCCSIYMRGIAWYYIPSTLLGMVDSCIGGKSAINVRQFKNLVGNFYPPQEVVVDPLLIHSLTIEQRVAGLCEAAKITFARGPDSFLNYLALYPQPSMASDSVASLIELSLRAKKWFIEIDEFDGNERQLLNFGHTFGHAIEGAGNYAITHGVAVGIGILAALAFADNILETPDYPLHVNALRAHIIELLSQVKGLKEVMQRLTVNELLEHFDSDKKHSTAIYIVITIDKSGLLQRYRIDKTPDNRERIKRAFDLALSELK